MELKGHHSKNTLNNFMNKISGIIICTFIKNIKMFEFQFFPVYGFAVGVNYWDSTMDDDEVNENDTQHMVQFFVFIFGLSIIWYKDL